MDSNAQGGKKEKLFWKYLYSRTVGSLFNKEIIIIF